MSRSITLFRHQGCVYASREEILLEAIHEALDVARECDPYANPAALIAEVTAKTNERIEEVEAEVDEGDQLPRLLIVRVIPEPGWKPSNLLDVPPKSHIPAMAGGSSLIRGDRVEAFALAARLNTNRNEVPECWYVVAQEGATLSIGDKPVSWDDLSLVNGAGLIKTTTVYPVAVVTPTAEEVDRAMSELAAWQAEQAKTSCVA